LEKTTGELPSAPLTLVLIEAEKGRPTGRRLTSDGLALEIVYNPAEGVPTLPTGPFKLIVGSNVYDLV
jgi:hypothetical protein